MAPKTVSGTAEPQLLAAGEAQGCGIKGGRDPRARSPWQGLPGGEVEDEPPFPGMVASRARAVVSGWRGRYSACPGTGMRGRGGLLVPPGGLEPCAEGRAGILSGHVSDFGAVLFPGVRGEVWRRQQQHSAALAGVRATVPVPTVKCPWFTNTLRGSARLESTKGFALGKTPRVSCLLHPGLAPCHEGQGAGDLWHLQPAGGLHLHGPRANKQSPPGHVRLRHPVQPQQVRSLLGCVGGDQGRCCLTPPSSALERFACGKGWEEGATRLQGLGTASRDDPSLSDGCGGDDHQTKASKKLTEEAVPLGSDHRPVICPPGELRLPFPSEGHHKGWP